MSNFSILPMQTTESDHKHVFFILNLPSVLTFKSQIGVGVTTESFK